MITQAALQHMGLSLDGEPDESQGQLFD
jgi:hypothetical protein